MQIDLSLFIGIILVFWLLLGFFLELINNKRFSKASKDIRLERKRCEVCSSIYFVSLFFEFWRCPLCGSVNRENIDNK